MIQKNKFLLNYKKLNVLITGTTGFKGAWLAYWLNNLGAKVKGVSLKPEKNSILFKSLKLENKIKQHYIDITNFKKLNNVIRKEKPDIIFHLAAQSIVSKSFENPLLTFNTNIIGSANILESFRVNKIPHLVYITSDKCYLNFDNTSSFKERDVLGGLDNYSSSKASAEILFSSYFNSFFKKEKNLSLASVRAGNVIGGGDMKINRIIPDIVKAFYNKKNIILRSPRSTRPWQHVLEPLSGYLLIGEKLLNKKLNNKILPSWNLGPETKNCKNVEFITKLFLKKLETKKSNIKVQVKNKKKFYESKFLSLNINKAKKELHWKPRLNLNQTISFTADWYKNYFEKKNMENFTEKQINTFLEN